MKRLILPTAMALVLSGGLAFAQTAAPAPDPQQAPAARPHHMHNPHKEAKRLSQALNLTPDQTAKLEPILADRDQKEAALMSNTSLDPKDMHKQRRAIERGMDDQLATVLTPDQLTQMKSMHHGHHGQPGTQPLAPPPPSA
jgi:protein CpxP